MFARVAIFCAVLLAIGSGLAAAENRSLLLGDRATQSIGDVDFMLPPIWHSLVKCGERITSESCLLQRMTETPTGTAPSVIIDVALQLAERIDRGRTDSADGFVSLRASQAYLVAAVYESEISKNAEARVHFQLAAARAGEVPRTMTTFAQTVTVSGRSQPPSLGGERAPENIRPVTVGAKGNEEPVKFYPEAQLVREYASRALAALTSN